VSGDVAAVAFLVVSMASLVLYSTALIALHRHPPAERVAYHGLTRTAGSRVLVAALYVTLGVLVLDQGDRLYTWVPLALFTAVQLVWQTNSLLDLRIKRTLARRTPSDAR